MNSPLVGYDSCTSVDFGSRRICGVVAISMSPTFTYETNIGRISTEANMDYILDDDRRKQGNRLHMEHDKGINNIERKDKPKRPYLDISKSGINDHASTRLKRTDRTSCSDPISQYEDDRISQHEDNTGE